MSRSDKKLPANQRSFSSSSSSNDTKQQAGNHANMRNTSGQHMLKRHDMDSVATPPNLTTRPLSATARRASGQQNSNYSLPLRSGQFATLQQKPPRNRSYNNINSNQNDASSIVSDITSGSKDSTNSNFLRARQLSSRKTMRPNQERIVDRVPSHFEFANAAVSQTPITPQYRRNMFPGNQYQVDTTPYHPSNNRTQQVQQRHNAITSARSTGASGSQQRSVRENIIQRRASNQKQDGCCVIL